MKSSNLSKGLVSLALAGSFVIGTGTMSTVQAQGRRDRQERRENRWEAWKDRQADRMERAQTRAELQRIRQLDHRRQLRYVTANGRRMVGYFDRSGDFHPIGFYDRRNQFWRYHQ